MIFGVGHTDPTRIIYDCSHLVIACYCCMYCSQMEDGSARRFREGVLGVARGGVFMSKMRGGNLGKA